MKLLVALAVLGCLIGANAECPHACHGNGRCTNYQAQFSGWGSDSIPNHEVPSAFANDWGYDVNSIKKDSCTCFTRVEDAKTVYAFTGADCSQRTCAFGKSWADPPSAINNHNQYTECSSRGKCDRKTGECQCFAGYTGVGCRRSTCPNDCSNHGVCETIREIAKGHRENTAFAAHSEFDYANINYENAWDAYKYRGCVCDAGYRGADCSIKECPSEVDPMGGIGHEGGRECSGRGRCEDGVCVCFDGFFGTACTNQRNKQM